MNRMNMNAKTVDAMWPSSVVVRGWMTGLVAALASLAQVHAANYTWSGPDGGTWDQTGTNWSPSGASWANPAGLSNVAQLGSSNVTVINGEVFVNSFSGSGSLSATANSTIRLGTGTSSFSGTIGQNLRVVWQGAATLDFSGTNNDTANQWVLRRNGILRLSSADAWKTNSNAKVEDSTANLGFTIELAAADESFNTTNLFLNNGITAGNGNFVRFAAIGADRTVTWTGGTPGGAATAINWNNAVGENLGDTLGLGNANATHKLIWASGINLNGGSGATLTRTINVTNGTAAVGGEISGVISDSGTTKATLLKTGSGTLILSGSNTYAGATIISAGTLQVGAGGTTGTLGTGGVTNNSALVFNRSNAMTVDNVIVGTGSLTKRGAGTLNLQAVNSFSGGVIIDNGTLAVGASGALAASTVAVNSGATLNNQGAVLGLIVNPGGLATGGGSYGTATNLSGGTLTPGVGGDTNFFQRLTLAGGSTNLFWIGSAATHDMRSVVTNSLDYTGSGMPQLKLDLASYTWNSGDQVVLYNNLFSGMSAFDGTNRWFQFTDAFGAVSNLYNNTLFSAITGGSSTNLFRINYDVLASGDGQFNDIAITAIPEPASLNLLLLIGAAYWLRRRLHSARRWRG
jgi:autotransporter-associated beta strand protein